MKLLLKDVKPNVAKMLSMASTDSRVVGYINEAQERLMYKGKWPGTYIRYSLTQSNGAITWPRQLETIESVAVAGVSGKVRDSWFEFLEAGPGLLDTDSGDSLTLVDRGEACTFSDIDISDDVDKKLRIKFNVADEAKTMILQGYNEDGEWIRSDDGGTIIDGEKVTLPGSAATEVDTTNKFQIISAVIKDVTKYNVTMWEVEATGTESERLIAEYEPGEEKPWYRRSLIPGLPDVNTTQTVTIVGKARFIPAVNDNDWLFINYESPIKEMVMSIKHAENNMIQEAEMFELRAVRLLNEQLMHFLGDGAVVAPRIAGIRTASGVENLQ